MRALVRLPALALVITLAIPAVKATISLPSDEQQRIESAFREYTITLTERLSTDPDPHRRMAAAILISLEAKRATAKRTQAGEPDVRSTPSQVTQDADELVRSALADAPDDPLLLWIAATNCPASSGACQPEYSLIHLRELTPGNAIVWLAPNAAHGEADPVDAPDESARLKAIAAATKVHSFDLDVERLLLDALTQEPLPPELIVNTGFEQPTQEKVAAMLATGFQMAFVAPQLNQFTSLCNGSALIAHGEMRHADCIAAMKNVRDRADTLLIRSVANIRLQMLFHGQEAAEAVAIEQRRSQWQAAAYMELRNPDRENVFSLVSDAEVEERLALLRNPSQNEISWMQERLRQANIPLDPPNDWSPNERAALEAL